MTLAVIVGLWGLLFPGFMTRESTVPHYSVQLQATQAPAAQESAKPSQPESQPAPTEPSATDQKPDAATPAPTPAKPKRKTHKKKSATPATDPPEKVVVRNGSTSDPNVKLSPPMSPKQTSNQRRNADDLLNGTESNLKQISGRTLTATQEETVKQIHSYMDQARKAISDGDLDRGRNLAFKAHLLSDDLVKH